MDSAWWSKNGWFPSRNGRDLSHHRARPWRGSCWVCDSSIPQILAIFCTAHHLKELRTHFSAYPIHITFQWLSPRGYGVYGQSHLVKMKHYNTMQPESHSRFNTLSRWPSPTLLSILCHGPVFRDHILALLSLPDVAWRATAADPITLVRPIYELEDAQDGYATSGPRENWAVSHQATFARFRQTYG